MNAIAEENRRQHYDHIMKQIAILEDINARLSDGRMRTWTQTLGSPMDETTQADIRSNESTIAMYRDVIDRFYREFCDGGPPA